MPIQPAQSTQNSFIGGLKTEFTGLNFPDNACTDTQNCVFSMIGDVTRREGFDFEENFSTNVINRTNQAISTYKWNNVGGDGEVQFVVAQIGSTLTFYESSNATTSTPLSTTLSNFEISLGSFISAGNPNDPSVTECQFSDGNGYLFVYHPDCDPFYCTFNSSTGSIIGTKINIQIRDVFGIFPEPGNPPINVRPLSATFVHVYNLLNQGWTSSAGWSTTSSNTTNLTTTATTINVTLGNLTFTVGSGLTINVGDPATLTATFIFGWNNGGVNYSAPGQASAFGSVISYSGTTLVVNVTNQTSGVNIAGQGVLNLLTNISWTIGKNGNVSNTLGTWESAIGNLPSNCDIWYSFKDTSNVFNPSVTNPNVVISTTPAPRGHFILNAFNQDRTAISSVSSLNVVSTTVRPRTGTWFQGRVFYAGADASYPATGTANYYTWTENIYFSQIITDTTQFGYCYQTNDPTDENLFDLLPSDGGVITIQGSGAIYKLFPLKNGLLVLAANGIWFVTGSSGVGFAANDFTVIKISETHCISGSSVISAGGFPLFWNEDGIYHVAPSSEGGSARSPDIALSVDNLCLGTILTFYQDIPLQSKKFARGDHNRVEYLIQWVFRSTNESSVTDRYQFDRILVYNLITKAFYYYTLPAGVPYIHDIRYVVGPGGSSSPLPVYKYLTSYVSGGNYHFTFSEERDDTNLVDWFTLDDVGVNYVSYFITGFKLSPRNHPFYGMYGQHYKKFQVGYIYTFLRNNFPNSYKLQGLWDFASSGNSGKWSTVQEVNDIGSPNFGMIMKRHKIRGHGLALQLKFQSVDGKPFDLMGWSSSEHFQSIP